jgi:hypothetical protein
MKYIEIPKTLVKVKVENKVFLPDEIEINGEIYKLTKKCETKDEKRICKTLNRG